MQHLLVKKPLYSAHFSFISSVHRLLSTSPPSAEAIIETPPVKSKFAFDYLVKSCGLPVEKAINASKKIPHLKSPTKADSVLQFLRQIGLGDADITRAVSSDPKLLCASLESTIKPRILKIQQIGFSPSQVARLIPLTPIMLKFKYSSLQSKIKFWTHFFGSLEGILHALKWAPYLLTVSVEKVVQPNILFLREHCAVSPIQIGKMIMRSPASITMNPKKLKEAAKRAEELGSPRGSGSFTYALQVVLNYTPISLDAKIKNLYNLGFSKKEIDSMVKRKPQLLTSSDERTRSIIGFLTSEAGLDLPSIARQPNLLTYSLERRMIPRHYVLKYLKTKGLSENWSFSSAVSLTEKIFADMLVRPYKAMIPEVFETYESALAACSDFVMKLADVASIISWQYQDIRTF